VRTNGYRTSQAVPENETLFRAALEEVFAQEFPRLFRFLDRLSGDPDQASDTAQEAFARLLRRGAMPDSPQAWLFTVALNLLRNTRATRARRRRLLSDSRSRQAHSDPGPPPDRVVGAEETRSQVRGALDRIPARDRDLLLLRAEGLGYREIARTLDLNEASVGTLLARAKKAFLQAYEGEFDAH